MLAHGCSFTCRRWSVKTAGSDSRPAPNKIGKRSREVRTESPSGTLDSVIRKVVRLGLTMNDESVTRLTRILSRLAMGSETDLRTPFFTTRSKGKLVYRPRSEIVNNFWRALDWNNANDLGTRVIGVLKRWEEENMANVGPMSPYLPFVLDGPKKAHAVMSDKRLTQRFDKGAHSRALERVRHLLAHDRDIKRISIHTAIEGVPDSTEEGMDTTTNSGLPYMMAGWKPSSTSVGPDRRERQEAFNYYIDRALRLEKELSPSILPTNKLPSWYAVSGQRLVQKGPKPYNEKSKRLVQMMPKDEAILAKTFTTPLQEELKKVKMPSGAKLFAAWYDLSVIDASMQVVLQHAHANGRTVLSGDISNFDATVPPFVLSEIGRVVASWFKDYSLAVNLINTMVYETGLVTPTMVYPPSVGSMRSGSGWTQVLGSLSNIYFQFYGEELGLYKIESLCVLGDDFVIDGPGVDPKSTSEVFSHFNMEAHPDKQFMEPDMLQFLKRTHIISIPGGIASACRTLGSTLSLERIQFRSKEWSPYAYIIRALSQLQNATFNPHFETLVNYLKAGDKYALGSNMSINELVGRAGNTGRKLLMDTDRMSWKRQGSLAFEDWSVNRVLRGESLPPLGKQRYVSVYGKSVEEALE